MINFIYSFSLLQQILLLVLALSILTQLFYYLLVYLRPILWRKKEIGNQEEPLSVIICAKNEAVNLKLHLPIICQQNYANYEVIVVNDCSTDDSELVLSELEQQYKNLRHTTIELDRKFQHGKKMAINIGIKSAKCNRLVFTDADCKPNSKEWLKHINNGYSDKTEIVLAYGGYMKTKGLLNRIIRFDTLFIALQYLGLAIAKRPYMGIGRNMSYHKSLYFSGQGFKKHYHLASGDDDLFINEHGNKSNTSVVISKESFTRSVPPKGFKIWKNQKRRHLTTAKHYKKSDKFLLGIENFSRFVFYTSLILSLVFIPNYILLGSLFTFRLLFQLVILKLGMNKLEEKGFLFLIPLFDIILPIIYICFIFANKLNTKRNKWS